MKEQSKYGWPSSIAPTVIHRWCSRNGLKGHDREQLASMAVHAFVRVRFFSPGDSGTVASEVVVNSSRKEVRIVRGAALAPARQTGPLEVEQETAPQRDISADAEGESGVG